MKTGGVYLGFLEFAKQILFHTCAKRTKKGTPRSRSVRNLLPYSGKAGTGRTGAPQCVA